MIVCVLVFSAAGVVFAAAAGEILPDVMHQNPPLATAIRGTLGVVVMLAIKQIETYMKGPVGLLTMVGVDIFMDGLVLGIGFAAGAKTGLLLTIALTLEVVFLGLTVSAELGESIKPRAKIVGITAALVLVLPLGTALAAPVTLLPSVVVTGFFCLRVDRPSLFGHRGTAGRSPRNTRQPVGDVHVLSRISSLVNSRRVDELIFNACRSLTPDVDRTR